MAYVPHTDQDRAEMLETLGLSKLDDLFASIPENIRLRRALDTPALRSEAEILDELARIGSANTRIDNRPSFLGAGVYRRFIPSAIDALSSRGEFNTAYTPYQAEVSQGTLQAIFEYQTMIARLTGMDISNASMYDAATALAEAVLMAWSARSKGRIVWISEGVHPEYRRVLATYLSHHPIELRTLKVENGRTPLDRLSEEMEQAGGDALAAVVQNPNFFGFLEDTPKIDKIFRKLETLSQLDEGGPRKKGPTRPLLIAVVDPISLAVVAPPGQWSADIALGDGQQLGNPPTFGGPSFGFFATQNAHVRKVPGRIVGETKDSEGRRGYVLTFQTREQHIRRERATSNICTNQGLCCLRGAMYLAFLGKEGIAEVARASMSVAHTAFERLIATSSIEAVSDAPFLNEFPLRLPTSAESVYQKLGEEGITGGLPLSRFYPDRENEMLFAFTEMTKSSDVDRLVRALTTITQRAGATVS
jgi:glycine dehydrogenase subunit 1